jgi:hypothetical protein
MHEYHVDVEQPNGGTQTLRVNVEDEHHHDKWDSTWKFISHLAALIGVGTGAVKGYKWVRNLRV